MAKISKTEAQRRAKDRARAHNTTVQHELLIIESEYTVVSDSSCSDTSAGSYGGYDGGSSGSYDGGCSTGE